MISLLVGSLPIGPFSQPPMMGPRIGPSTTPIPHSAIICGCRLGLLVSSMKAGGHRDARLIDGPAALAPLIAEIAKPDDYVVCLGAGTITAWANALPKQLAS